MVKISVIVPVYNMAAKLKDCLTSLLSQTYGNYEIILVDDGSTDGSSEVCDSIAAADARVRVIHTANQGSGPARNEGIRIAAGDFAYFPDADDLIEKDALSVMAKAVDESHCDLLVFGYKYVAANGRTISVKSYENSLLDGASIRADYSEFMTMDGRYGIQGAPWNKLFKLKIIKENQLAFPALRRHQDDAFIGLYMGYVSSVQFIGDVLYTYYTNDLQREWDKYPANYLDSVIGVLDCQKKSILLWNPEDTKTRDIILTGYICRVIKVLELSFSPKMNFNKKQRIQWQLDVINRSKISDYDLSDVFRMPYQLHILRYIKNQQYSYMYMLLLIKVFVERYMYKLLRVIKRSVQQRG